MALSQNGWPAISGNTSPPLHTWVIPAKNGEFKLRLRQGSAGFLLAHYALWHAENVEDATGFILDDWGWAFRSVRGQSTGLSNHASGTAMDLNAVAHQLGRSGTYSGKQESAIHKRLRQMHGVIRWGGDYRGRKDEMHFEVVQSLPAVEREAKRWMTTYRGRRILKANPSQKRVILS